uniref:Uncharacterized protein n=1 Tax=Arundo donax TaxID=35708 RepID=A0A0A9BHL7_ARUDO
MIARDFARQSSRFAAMYVAG